MNSAALLVVAIAVVPTFGMAVWIWLAGARMDDELRSFTGFDGRLHVDELSTARG